MKDILLKTMVAFMKPRPTAIFHSIAVMANFWLFGIMLNGATIPPWRNLYLFPIFGILWSGGCAMHYFNKYLKEKK